MNMENSIDLTSATESQYYYCINCQKVVINPRSKECPLCKGKLVPAEYGEDGFVRF